MSKKSARQSSWNEAIEHPWGSKVEKAFRETFYRLARLWIPAGNSEPIRLEKVRRLLLVKEPYRMGDLLQITPLVRALKSQFPHLEISLLLQRRNEPLFRHNPHLSHVYVYEKERAPGHPLEFLLFLKSLRCAQFDLSVTLETERAHFTNDFFAYLTKAPQRLRLRGSDLNHAASDVFYTHFSHLEKSDFHMTQRNAAVFKNLIAPIKDLRLELFWSAAEAQKADAVWASIFPGINPKECVLIHPGAFKLLNRWPLENYLELARYLPPKKVGFMLGPSEWDWDEKIAAAGFSVLPRLSILELAALLSRAGLVLCNDTGILHIAGAVRVPTLALFGGTISEHWKPQGDIIHTLQAPTSAMQSLSVHTVWEKIESLL